VKINVGAAITLKLQGGQAERGDKRAHPSEVSLALYPYLISTAVGRAAEHYGRSAS
jgi:hypothetical protein